MSDVSETYVFQAEINQLLTLIINAFYSDKDVFLRELVSNASDALDKHRYTSLSAGTPPDIVDVAPLRIRISFDKDAKTLSIEDNGIGMTRGELVDNLGTIAKSGTKQFMEALALKGGDQGAATNLIGQFGMGFYSAFLVATTVSAYSKSESEEKTHVWKSSASGTFEVSDVEYMVPPLTRGTRIVMSMKDDCTEYLSESKLREIFKKHSEFVPFPVELYVEEEQRVEEDEDNNVVDITEGEAAAPPDDGVVEDDADADDADTPPTTIAPKFEKVNVWKQINTNKAIWSCNPEEVTQSEYDMFYRGVSSDWQAPLCHIHFRAEGQFKFDGLFFVPQHPPFAPDGRASSNKGNVKLYVNRVFVTDVLQTDVLPDYLSFARGLVDSEDLPLNISREMLQKTKVLSVIKRTCVKKIIDALLDLASTKPESYASFWKVYGKYVRWGITDDTKNQEKLSDLLRFESTQSNKQLTSLAEYVSRMKPDQHTIQYITGESRESVETSVFLECFKNAGIEVLFMTDAIDEYMVQSMQEYKGKKLVSVSAPQSAPTDDEDVVETHQRLCTRVKEVLGEEVSRVMVTKRLVDAPCAIVTEGYGPSANMERIIKAQAIQADNPMMQQNMRASRVMEINVDHSLVKNMLESLDDVDDKKTDLDKRIMIMHGTGLLASGFTLDNPSGFAKLVTEHMA
jgi:molecular chaperone HtpG